MNKRKAPLPIVEKLEILDAGSEGKCIGRQGELVIFVPFVVPGDIVDVQLLKKKRNYAEGKAVKFHQYSGLREPVFCNHFGTCGGCRWQNMRYDVQSGYKQKQVTDAFDRIGKFPYPAISPILVSEETQYYRNKLEYTFSHRRWLVAPEGGVFTPVEDTRGLGFHLPTMFDRVLDIDQCYLQADPSNEIRNAVREFTLKKGYAYYNPRSHEGFLRNLVIRNNSKGSVMVIMVFAEDRKEDIRETMEFIRDSFTAVTSLYYIINTKKNDTYSDLEPVLFSGNEYLPEYLEGLEFRIGPLSFYQVNVEQSARLYAKVREFAALTGKEIVYDLYTGTGTIGLYLASQAARVLGIEYVDAAIRDAFANAAHNGIHNVHFIAGDLAKTLTPELCEEHGFPEVVVVDPPRSGLHEKVVERLLEMKPDRIVYVSCNPATQARDIGMMQHAYTVTAVQPVDMFPHTQHVENVALLERIS